jgi:hypothetical protein
MVTVLLTFRMGYDEPKSAPGLLCLVIRHFLFGSQANVDYKVISRPSLSRPILPDPWSARYALVSLKQLYRGAGGLQLRRFPREIQAWRTLS